MPRAATFARRMWNRGPVEVVSEGLSNPEPRRGGPLVIAHRGASDEEPEHTLAAYRRAFAHGADGVECDVRLTADHHLVCVHDRRIERTSNGRGVVSALELALLEELDWASWRTAHRPGDTELPEADPERGHLLTLRRLLDTLVDTGQEVVTLIETKHPGDRSTYLGNFETVSQADAKMIAIGCDKHLCLVPQAPKGNRVNDAITVALKRGPWTASFAKGFQMLPSLAGGRIACVGRSRPHFAATLVTT